MKLWTQDSRMTWLGVLLFSFAWCGGGMGLYILLSLIFRGEVHWK